MDVDHFMYWCIFLSWCVMVVEVFVFDAED